MCAVLILLSELSAASLISVLSWLIALVFAEHEEHAGRTYGISGRSHSFRDCIHA